MGFGELPWWWTHGDLGSMMHLEKVWMPLALSPCLALCIFFNLTTNMDEINLYFYVLLCH